MARKIKFSSNSLIKLDNFKDSLKESSSSIFKKFYSIVYFDFKNIKDCAESSIVDFYIEETQKFLEKHDTVSDDDWDKIKQKVRKRLVKKFAPYKNYKDNISVYFDEVKRQYIMHPMGESEDLVFCPENKDIFIKNNLKLVIDCAKRYQNLGIPFEDLIQCGNMGLLKSFEKFDSSRANLRFAILEDIREYPEDKFDYETARKIIEKNFTYTKLLNQTLKKLPKEGFKTKKDFNEWTMKNIKKASFSSIAFAWIRANIIIELNNYSRIIKIPKSVQASNAFGILRLDSINPHTDDNYTDGQLSDISNEEFLIENEMLENDEHQEALYDIVINITQCLSGDDRRILFKKFGIGFPFPLSLSEIAENEGISLNKVKYSISNSIKTISEKVTAENKISLKEILNI